MAYNLSDSHPLHAEITLKILFLIDTSHSLSFKICSDVKIDTFYLISLSCEIFFLASSSFSEV